MPLLLIFRQNRAKIQPHKQIIAVSSSPLPWRWRQWSTILLATLQLRREGQKLHRCRDWRDRQMRVSIQIQSGYQLYQWCRRRGHCVGKGRRWETGDRWRQCSVPFFPWCVLAWLGRHFDACTGDRFHNHWSWMQKNGGRAHGLWIGGWWRF